MPWRGRLELGQGERLVAPRPQETQESEYSPSPSSLRHVALELWIEETDMWM